MARTKNRFNAVAVPETASVGAPVKKAKTFRVALYARLSVELKARPSESIANQLDIMREFIKGRAEFAEYHEYVDSAVSGTSFNRPSFNRMMDDVRDGKISCIIVKDMSRFGRDYIEAGNYIETIFPFLGVRFISINDHFDTEAEFNQNKSLFEENGLKYKASVVKENFEKAKAGLRKRCWQFYILCVPMISKPDKMLRPSSYIKCSKPQEKQNRAELKAFFQYRDTIR